MHMHSITYTDLIARLDMYQIAHWEEEDGTIHLSMPGHVEVELRQLRWHIYPDPLNELMAQSATARHPQRPSPALRV